MASPTLSQSSLGNLDDLDLESASAHPHSRPIGESSKYRSTSHVMHISHADITEMEALMRHDEETSLLSFMATGEELRPGSNRFTLKGKVRLWAGLLAGKGYPAIETQWSLSRKKSLVVGAVFSGNRVLEETCRWSAWPEYGKDGRQLLTLSRCF